MHGGLGAAWEAVSAKKYSRVQHTGNHDIPVRWFWLLSLQWKSHSVTIQIKASEQYFPLVLFIMLYKVFLTFKLWMKSYGMTIQMKATE